MGAIVDILKLAGKAGLFLIMMASVSIFTNYLIGLIPPINLNGCIGYWVNSLGLIMGLSITLSIVMYGFVFKIALGFISRYLD